MKIKFIFKIIVSALLLGTFLFPGSVVRADISETMASPLFDSVEKIKANGIDLQVPRDGGGTNYYSVPCVVDWNNDGKKDLLIGCFYNGSIYFYRNWGTNNAPVFTTSSKLRADGVDLSVNYGDCMGAYPQVADWNDDGKKDLLVGDTDGRITYYKNTNNNVNPVLTRVGFIKAGSFEIVVNKRATPVVVDWNNDGKQDLVVGEYNDGGTGLGFIRLYLNIGTNSAPSFSSSYQRLKVGSSYIRFAATAPEICDLDGDGKKDLIVGESNGYVYFYKNTGTDANPFFTSGERLLAGSGYMKVSYFSRPEATDWNGDGKIDLLLGDYYGYVNLFKNASSKPTVATTVASYITSYSAQLNGTVNPNGNYTTFYFQYGLTTSYGSTSSSSDAGSGTYTVSVNRTISGLEPDRIYHYRIVATNSYGTSVGNDMTFSTLPVLSVATPTFSPSPGTYSNSLNVTISCLTSGATIRYTLNGMDPTEMSPIYTSPIPVVNCTMIKARAYKSTWTPSHIAIGTYTIIQPTLRFAINSGGSGFYDHNGKYWAADQPYNAGSFGYVSSDIGTYETTDPISNTSDDVLYQSERSTMSSYRFDVPNGNYKVQLLFAEIWFTNPGRRIMDVKLEGMRVLDDLDIYAMVSHDAALNYTFYTQVNDGRMDIDFSASVNNPKISAIEIIQEGVPSVQDISINPGYWNFGSLVVGNYIDKTFVIRNDGGANLNVTSITIVSNNTDFSIISGGGSFTLTAGATRNLVIRFKPTSTGSKAAPIRIYSNDPDENPKDVGLNGVGVTANTYYANRIPQGMSPPVIDGVLNEPFWSLIKEETLTGGGVPDAWNTSWSNWNDNLVTFKAVWSQATNRLYVAVKVIDDVRGTFDNSDPNTYPYDPWKDESIEFFTDGDNSGGDFLGKYGPAQQWRVSELNIRNLAYYPSYDKFYVYNGTDFITAVTQGANGNWSCEAVFIIYNTLPTVPKTLAEGNIIGWNVWYNDSDNESVSDGHFERDHQTGWVYTGPAWSNADHFGDLILTGDFIVPDISATPPLWNYGEVTVNQYSDKIFVIKNEGTADLYVTETKITGNSAEFSIQSGGGAFPLVPGAVRNIVVRFAPVNAGNKSANLTISSNDPDENPLQISLSGIGKSQSVPDISVTPISWDFGSVPINSYSEKIFEIKNEGAANLNVTATNLNGTNSSEFSVQNGGAFSLAPGQTWNITIRFNPASTGNKSASLRISSDDPDENPYFIQLTGNCISPSVVIYPNAFANQMAGSEFILTVDIGSTVKPVTNLFGLSFNLNFTKTEFLDVVIPHSNNVTPGSFLGNDILFFQSVDESMGKIGIGMSRKMGQGGVNGYGTIAQIKFFINSSTPDGTIIQFSLNDVNATDPNGTDMPLNTSTLTIQVISGLIVWPGDTDNNGIVNAADILPIGLHWSLTGPPRTCHSNESIWLPHNAKPWNTLKATYADANGNGTVEQGDILPIGLNWNRTHSNLVLGKMNPNMADVSTTSAKLLVEISGELLPNNDFTIFIIAKNIKKLFGISYQLIYTPASFLELKLIEPGPQNILGNDHLFYLMNEKNAIQDTGKVSFGISRKSGQGRVDVDSGLVTIIQARMSPNAVIGHSLTKLFLENIQAIDDLGNPIAIDTTCFNLRTEVQNRIMEEPTDFSLDQNYPNPFNPSTIISFQVKKRVPVKLTIYDLLGKEIITLVNKTYDPGKYQVSFSADGLSSGVYLYHIQMGDYSEMRKMVKFK
ncbi:choice-of-anchor D domain-containing protein [candidate division KSB1 bacterium]|nr:choice-of-anchor D domain-containing protein [candidate division KSB1 bacterium]